MKTSCEELMHNDELIRKVDPKKNIGKRTEGATVQDILAELAHSGRDPREEFEPFSLLWESKRWKIYMSGQNK